MSDASELERQAEAARARLSDTAEQIRARMSPGQLMDEVLNQFRDGDGSQMLANLRGQVRDNPMALALVGSGLAWLMMGSGARPQGPWRYPSTQASPKAPPYPATDTGNFATYRLDEEARTGAGATGAAAASSSSSDSSAMGSLAGSVSDTVGGMARSASDALASARSAVGEGLHEAGDRAQRMAHDLRVAGSETVGELRHSAAGAGYQARDTFLDILEREPLVIGAVGFAVGAAIGAFLPATEVEREHLGPAGEALKEKADALVDRGMAKAKEAAAEVYETARDEADRQGLLPGEKPIAEKVDAVVRAIGETAGEIVERNAPESSGTGSGSGTSHGTSSGLDPHPSRAMSSASSSDRPSPSSPSAVTPGRDTSGAGQKPTTGRG